MGVVDHVNAFTLQFVVDALRTMNTGDLDLSVDANRRKHNTDRDLHQSGHRNIRNPDGTAMTIAQIATAAGLTTAQVTDIAKRA